MDTVSIKIAEIKEMIGIDLVPCDHFAGVNESKRGLYFNVTLDTPVFISEEYNKLLYAAEKGFIEAVEPNGYKRLAIFY